ncbi:methyl-accepting chemotaxis protein [Pseudoalteromonas sp. S16_S37]|uniref:methyl-accepting chemotaxis protein n=1 Tax=Pseudoalteromonas sp. S16_S37 TaxID=2720228 RepID=UPI00168177CC|nr:methyl-accepting chemotaxis protein [Pseudoalteromonas sp. S16_S37]MBD1584789.1 PAS domain S-box protein [Pseudoalteromonas sp. S16_S37]
MSILTKILGVTVKSTAELQGLIAAINKSQAVIEFDLAGNILTANDNFLNAVGYRLDEIVGKHHRIFVDPAQHNSAEYQHFWQKLAKGQFDTGQYKRIRKDGREIWIQASYNAILDENNRPFKVVKFATDITKDVMRNADYSGQLSAISKSQAIIEFDLNGHILTANENFLATVGYQLAEIVGKHHRIFVEPSKHQSQEYQQFWQKLARGEYDSGQYKRITKEGHEIWIQASYNAIMDAENRPYKVVKFATDITKEVMRNADYSGQLSAIGKSQAVIEFDLQGNILTANENFLAAVGYQLAEIVGKHHRIFVEPAQHNSPEYKIFWQKLARGEFDSGQYKRITKEGREIWIQASYNAIMDAENRPYKVVKYATDITKEVVRNADYSGQLAAISKSQAVIEFDLFGHILTANDNFSNAVGYSLADIKGKHHSIFIEADLKNSEEYRRFWERLSRGEYDTGQYKRIGNGGKEIWIQASYNPIMDASNKPVKVVKYATDITEQVKNANAMKQTVDEVQDVVKAAVAGDLTQKINVDGKIGLLAILSEGINALLENMHDIVGQIKDAAEEISVGASEISTGNSDLSSRTEQQASSLEETASSMEELTSTVRLNAENAKQANVLAEQASKVAQDGGTLIQQVVVTMSSISEASQKIADIISVIDGIAFQTNLLALNAAVEAARAGEQGRGFAVVASEVRTLAQRSANAAKDIKGLIFDSVKKIETGNLLVGKSGDTMQEIVTSIQRVNAIMAQIAMASTEQSQGINEVSKAVSQMDQMTQQNAALVEEAAAAAESLQTQAHNLRERVAQFRVKNKNSTTQSKVTAKN